MNSNLIILLVYLFTITSCSVNHYITISKDGSALVNVDKDYDKSIIENYYRSELISNIDTNLIAGRVIFEISNVDSLGKYLPYHKSGFFSFKKEKNVVIISDSHTNAFRVKSLFCCHMTVVLKFQDGIQSLESNENNKIKVKKNGVLIITKTRRQLLRERKKINLTIVLEENH